MSSILYNYTIMLVKEFSKYSGRSYLLVFYLLIIFHMYIMKENYFGKSLAQFQIIYFILNFNPVIYIIIYKIVDQGTFYRYFWPFIYPILLAYVITIEFKNIKNEIMRISFIIIAIVFIIISGKIVYRENSAGQYMQNIYKIPPQYIELSSKLNTLKSGEIRIIAPTDVNEIIRQYDASIKISYLNSNALDSNSNEELNQEYLYNEMISKDIDYFIINASNQEKVDSLASHFKFISNTECYEIYGIRQ